MDFGIAFALFLGAMLLCLIRGYALSWALAFALALFFAVGLRRGYKTGALAKMAWSKMPKTMIVLRIIFLIGILTGVWRSCGTIAFFIYYGVRAIPPSVRAPAPWRARRSTCALVARPLPLRHAFRAPYGSNDGLIGRQCTGFCRLLLVLVARSLSLRRAFRASYESNRWLKGRTLRSFQSNLAHG